MFNIVLYAPEIPANTGNIGVPAWSPAPICIWWSHWAFRSMTRRYVAPVWGYWQNLDVTTHAGWEDFL